MAKKKKTLEMRKCVVCGKEFMQIRSNQLVCGEECRRKRDRVLQKQWREKNIGYMSKKTGQEMLTKEIPKKEKPKIKRSKNNYEKIVDIAIAARKEGLTYGQYVAKYMGRKA